MSEKGKIGANIRYDHLSSIQKDPLVPLKLKFVEVTAETLNSFLVLYHTDKLMVPFLAESLESLLRSLCVKFIRKDVLESAKTNSLLIKLDLFDKTNQRDINNVDLGFGIKYKLKRLTDSKKVTCMQVFNLEVFDKSLQPCN